MDQVPPELVQDSPDPESAPSLFVVTDEHLAGSLGLGRSELRAARLATTRGVDWQVRGHRVYWTEKAASVLALRQQPQNGSDVHSLLSDATATPPACGAATVLSAPEVLRVTAWNFPNSRVIHCVAENNGHHPSPITVRVKDARLFRSGMRVLARPALGSAWEFLGNPERPDAGPRYPRRPGAW